MPRTRLSPPPTPTTVYWQGDNDIEVSVAVAPKPLVRELKRIFPGESLGAGSRPVLAVLTCQCARHDLVRVGEEIEEEKDRLLRVFHQFANYICDELAAQGRWADLIDPCSGLPMRCAANCSNVYSEVDGFELLLHYRTQSCGPCKILYHPRWGSRVYPCSLFTDADAHEVQALLRPLLTQWCGLWPTGAAKAKSQLLVEPRVRRLHAMVTTPVNTPLRTAGGSASAEDGAGEQGSAQATPPENERSHAHRQELEQRLRKLQALGVDPRLQVLEITDPANPARGGYGLFALPTSKFSTACEMEADNMSVREFSQYTSLEVTEDGDSNDHQVREPDTEDGASLCIPAHTIIGEYVGEVRTLRNRSRRTRLTFKTTYKQQPEQPAPAEKSLQSLQQGAKLRAIQPPRLVYASCSRTATADDQYVLLLEHTTTAPWARTAAQTATSHRCDDEDGGSSADDFTDSGHDDDDAGGRCGKCDSSGEGKSGHDEEEDASDDICFVDARLHRNALAFANDPRAQGKGAGCTSEPRIANARAVELLIAGWPHVFFVTSREIYPGQEVLFSYGDSFWASQEKTAKLMQNMDLRDEYGERRYDSADFWASYYAASECRGQTAPEWLETKHAVRDIITGLPCFSDPRASTFKRTILCLGCGDDTDLLQLLAKPHESFIPHVLGVDFAQTAITFVEHALGLNALTIDDTTVENMSADVDATMATTDRDVDEDADARISVQCADVRTLGWQVQGTFDVIVDKATLDAVACSLTAIEDVELLLLGAARRLAPGGSYVLISYRPPSVLMRHLQDPRLQWDVTCEDTPAGHHCYTCTRRQITAAATAKEASGAAPTSNADISILRGLHSAMRRRAARTGYLRADTAASKETAAQYDRLETPPAPSDATVFAEPPVPPPPSLAQLRCAGPNTARTIYGGDTTWGLISHGCAVDDPDVDAFAEWACDVCGTDFCDGADDAVRAAPRVRCVECADFDVCAQCFRTRFATDCWHAHHASAEWVVFGDTSASTSCANEKGHK